MSAEVIIYTTGYCGYCMLAKRLLSQKGISYREVDVGGQPELRSWLRDRAQQRTVPQVFINGSPIGGYSELSRLERRGELDHLLRAREERATKSA